LASKTKAVLDALKLALLVEHTGTVHQPDAVHNVLFWPDESKLDPTMTTLYFVRPGEERGVAGPESCSITEILEVFILAATRYEEASQKTEAETVRLEIVLDLVADVKEKLQNNLHLRPTPASDAVAIDVYREGTVVDAVEIRLAIKYRYEKTERA
jgi:hypothetical protein